MPIHAATHIDALCHIGEQQDAAGNPISGGQVQLYAGPSQTVAACEKVDHKARIT
jgi:kynurenine formamidase